MSTPSFFLGNKILDELKILIRIAAPDAGYQVKHIRRKRRAKPRTLRDAA